MLIPYPLPKRAKVLTLLSLYFTGQSLNSSPFKGEAERGMGFLFVWPITIYPIPSLSLPSLPGPWNGEGEVIFKLALMPLRGEN